MGNGFYVRGQSAPDTMYDTYRAVHSMRNANDNSANAIDADTGNSPSMRVLAYAFSWEDVDATAFTVLCRIPRGALIKDAWIRVDEAFVGAGATAVIGDVADPDGYLTSTNLTTATPGDYVRTPLAVYVVSQVRAYPDGDSALVTLDAVPTAGQAILFLTTPSYNEPLGAEWL